MPQVCFYFQLHQPYRLGDYSLFDLGANQSYFEQADHNSNKAIFSKVTEKSYRPMLKLLLKLVKKYPGFKFAVSCSGVFLEQAQTFEPEVVELLQKLIATGQVEMLAETYYHSLASLYSSGEFRHQVAEHERLIKKLFGVKPKVFRNTELIYSNDVARQVSAMGYIGMLTEAVPRYLHDRGKTVPYQSVHFVKHSSLPLLLKHAELSDDIAFRFSDKNWQWFPLTVERYLEWVEIYPEDECVNLFMDFETFGEHQWESTGIFEFFAAFVKEFLNHEWNVFKTPSELLEPLAKNPVLKKALPIYDVPDPISWADVDRDLTAWVDNAFQRDCLRIIYELEEEMQTVDDPTLLSDWRKLQTSDHFYYMCTKWAADGDVHAYFSPYKSPHEAYRRYSIVLADLRARITNKKKKITSFSD